MSAARRSAALASLVLSLDLSLVLFAPVTLVGCREPSVPRSAKATRYFDARVSDTRFRTAEHFLAGIEMQLSGEPLAEALGRDLALYNRAASAPDFYYDAAAQSSVIDPLGFSLAIESYEYSKQPMNNTSFESGAGLSLQFGPLLNPEERTADEAYELLRDRLQHLAAQAGAAGPPGTNWVVSPAPDDNPLNVYGWPGFWPVHAEFASFRPEIEPVGGAARGCSFTFGYGASALGAQAVGDYECGYNSLNLPSRDKRVEKILAPDALGYAMWKQALWTINYWQALHDSGGNLITEVDARDLALCGTVDNTVIGRYRDPARPDGALIEGQPGVWLGDTPLEGWQGLVMIEEMDNKAALTLRSLLTSDGKALGGFATVREALAYDHAAPLRFWPAAIAVTESALSPPPGRSWQYFPRPTALRIERGSSLLRGLSAMAGGAAQLYAMTDRKNPDVGGSAPELATFDGDPFPGDNGLPDGEESPHDRALATLKVALVNLDRLHFDAARGVLVDEAVVEGGAVRRLPRVTTVDAAYAVVALRAAIRSLTSSLTLYGNDTADTAGLPGALDTTSRRGSPGGASLTARLRILLRAQAEFLRTRLIAADGAVTHAVDLEEGTTDDTPTRIESQAAALRGLLEAWLATSDVAYRDAAARVYQNLEARFWMADVRAFRTVAGESDTQRWTPMAFGTLSGALRQYWKHVARRPGSERAAAELLERLLRLGKLVLNGWDDANADNVVQYPSECTGGGLQLAERALTGENSRAKDRGDRDHDCVLEIAAAGLPAALGSEVVFTRRR